MDTIQPNINSVSQKSLNNILSFLPYFLDSKNNFGEFYEFEKPKDFKPYFEEVRHKVFPYVKQLNNNVYVSYSNDVESFIKTIIDSEILVDLGEELFSWKGGLRLIHSPYLIKESKCDKLRMLLSMIFLRSSHYEEYLLIMINKGIIKKILERLEELVNEDE